MTKSILVPLFMLWITLHATAQQDAVPANGKHGLLFPERNIVCRPSGLQRRNSRSAFCSEQTRRCWYAKDCLLECRRSRLPLVQYDVQIMDVRYHRQWSFSERLVGTAIYDATVAAWDTKYAHNRPRPFAVNSDIKLFAPKPESPSYPCEYSVAAGVAVALISHFYPNLTDSVNRMAQQLMASRVAAGVVFPSDTRAGFELGKKIAAKEIEQTKNFLNKKQFDGKIPQKPGLWTGKNPMLPMAGLNKTIVLESARSST